MFGGLSRCSCVCVFCVHSSLRGEDMEDVQFGTNPVEILCDWMSMHLYHMDVQMICIYVLHIYVQTYILSLMYT